MLMLKFESAGRIVPLSKNLFIYRLIKQKMGKRKIQFQKKSEQCQ